MNRPIVSATVERDLEVQQGQAASLADLLHAVSACNPDDDRAEDQRPDRHLHELDEALCQRIEVVGAVRRERPYEDPDRDSDEDPKIQGPYESELF